MISWISQFIDNYIQINQTIFNYSFPYSQKKILFPFSSMGWLNKVSGNIFPKKIYIHAIIILPFFRECFSDKSHESLYIYIHSVNISYSPITCHP
jgi:hypothetical protein